MKNWDEELKAIEGDVASLTEASAKRRARDPRGLIAAKVALIQTRISLENQYKRIRALVSKDLLLLPKEKAIQRWGRVWLDAAERFTALRQSQTTQALWLKLIRTRLGNAAQEGLDGEDLVSLSVRRANLAKTERYLETTLAKLKIRRHELREIFRQRDVVAANCAAATTLKIRLGPSLEAAVHGPEMTALNMFFMISTEPLRSPEAAATARRNAAKLDDKGKTLLGAAKRLALSREQPSAKALDRFQSALVHLNDLEAEADAAYMAMQAPSAPVDRLHIVMQKGVKNAKKV